MLRIHTNFTRQTWYALSFRQSEVVQWHDRGSYWWSSIFREQVYYKSQDMRGNFIVFRAFCFQLICNRSGLAHWRPEKSNRWWVDIVYLPRLRPLTVSQTGSGVFIPCAHRLTPKEEKLKSFMLSLFKSWNSKTQCSLPATYAPSWTGELHCQRFVPYALGANVFHQPPCIFVRFPCI